METILIASLLR